MSLPGADTMAAPLPHQTSTMRLLNRVGPVVAPRWPSLDMDDIVRAAARAAKSDRFGDESFLEALPVLSDAIEREADLTWLGRVMFRQSLVGFLQNRFSIYRYRGRMTEIAQKLGIGRSTLYRKMREFGLEAS